MSRPWSQFTLPVVVFEVLWRQDVRAFQREGHQGRNDGAGGANMRGMLRGFEYDSSSVIL